VADTPVISLPTATNDLAGTGHWAIGAAGLVLRTTGPWVLGALAFQLWDFAGHANSPGINQFNLQPFINYNLRNGWAFATAPIIIANWDAESGQQWTVPLGGGVTHFGRRPISLSAQCFYHVERPQSSGTSLFRFVVSLLYPQLPQPQSQTKAPRAS